MTSLINLDLDTLKQEALSFKNQYPNLVNWDLSNFNDPMGMVLAYYLTNIERFAKFGNNTSQDFALTSSISLDAGRQHSISNGYVPTTKNVATGLANLVFNGGATFNIQPYSIIVSLLGFDGVKVYYSNVSPIYLTNSVTAVSGVDFTEGVLKVTNRISNGLPNQSITLTGSPVLASVKVYVNGELWTSAYSLAASTPTSKTYILRSSANNTVMISFGDNIRGVIPPQNAEIVINYLDGGGIRGNVTSSTPLKMSLESFSSESGLVSVATASTFSGGEDDETLDHINTFGPYQIKSQSRLGNEEDVVAFASSQNGIVKCSAIVINNSVVNVYVVPSSGGYASAAFITSLQNSINSNIILGCTSRVFNVNYIAPKIVLEMSIYNNYVFEQVAADVRSAILALIDPTITNSIGAYNNDIGSNLFPNHITDAVKKHLAVNTVRILSPQPQSDGVLYRVRKDQVLTNIDAEIIISQSGRINVTQKLNLLNSANSKPPKS